jgi:hypothetical protein
MHAFRSFWVLTQNPFIRVIIRPVIRPVIHPSKFLIPEEKDDGRGGRRGRMAAITIYPNVYATSHWLKSTATNFLPEFSPS